ncbi:MAG: hypothetical protein KKE09_19600 [Bacteroidetes bacterium]|nr:hypothetical protein [Bacteroidota bacterium]
MSPKIPKTYNLPRQKTRGMSGNLSFACHSQLDNETMKPSKPTASPQTSGVEKVLLQMARCGNDWAGKATCFSGPTEFHFDSLKDLFDWLKKRAEKD